MPIAAPTRRLALLLALALPLSLAAQTAPPAQTAPSADDAAHRAKAQEMMEQLHAHEMVAQVSVNLNKQLDDAGDKAIGPNPTPENTAKLAAFKKQAAQAIEDELGWKVMQVGFTDVYAKTFTDEELSAIVAFYKSPAGAALLAKMPTVNSQVDKFGNSRMTVLQPELKKLFEDFKASLSTPPPTLGPVLPGPVAPSAPASTPSAPK
jgi:hypothetical protein